MAPYDFRLLCSIRHDDGDGMPLGDADAGVGLKSTVLSHYRRSMVSKANCVVKKPQIHVLKLA